MLGPPGVNFARAFSAINLYAIPKRKSVRYVSKIFRFVQNQSSMGTPIMDLYRGKDDLRALNRYSNKIQTFFCESCESNFKKSPAQCGEGGWCPCRPRRKTEARYGSG